ncbi:F0F1 ATP synthase subunit A [Nocardioides sp. Kera G14]|uniref:F0F1 ATP synthase subunit A n=1 Tax=Nocardioides sp. Kera G14 TaxID=2884264 RepID=UPI001D105CCA|nr:F0F1 ATP synthase subunit A [Nocardioides sp. Kera G14]UDY24726.1 F0F1 ATP synthase subunit A [Nocardioides sp. Kera G14]
MSLLATMIPAEDFTAPGPSDFDLPAVFGDVTKPMLLVVLSAIIAVGLFWAMSRKAAIVPGRLQFAGEYVYGFVRNTIARDTIGGHDYMKYVPLLFGIFTVVLINNFFGVIPFIQFPTMSHIGYTAAIALVIWATYNIAGIIKHGFFGYLKHQTVPAGISGPILIMLIPLEFFSNIIVRPFTLALRLFATMFAGHLLLSLFSIGGEFLILHHDPKALGVTAGVLSYVIGIGVSFLDMLVMFLQAYVITLLSAMYIGSAIADEH